MVEKCYIQNGTRDSLTEKDFTPEEWSKIMAVQEPNVLGETKVNQTKSFTSNQGESQNSKKDEDTTSPMKNIDQKTNSSLSVNESEWKQSQVDFGKENIDFQNLIEIDNSDETEELW